MINDKKQTIDGVKDSTVNQIAGDQIQIGISVEDAFAISRNVIKQELSLYTDQALKTAESRFKEIADKTIDRINLERADLFPKFKDPAIQVVLNEIYKKYIETGDEELGENLINMLLDRLEAESKSTKQFIIDDAREILPKLSIPNLSFLALTVFSMVSIPTNNINEYSAIIKKLINITSGISSLSNIDIMYLKQSGCVMGVPMIQITQKIVLSLFKEYEYYFSKGINTTQFNGLIQKHAIDQSSMKNILSLIDIRPNNNFGLRFSSKRRFDDFFLQHDLPKIKLFFEEFISLQNQATNSDVINFHQSIDPSWNHVFSLWDKDIVTTLSIMPVGLYLGSVYLRRALGLKIPQDIFYQ